MKISKDNSITQARLIYTRKNFSSRTAFFRNNSQILPHLVYNFLRFTTSTMESSYGNELVNDLV